MAKSGGTPSYSDGGDLDNKLSAIANYGNNEASNNGFKFGKINWGEVGQYLPAINQLIGNMPIQNEYNQTPDYILPFYDAGSYTSNGFTAGGYRGLNSNVSNKLSRYKQRKQDLANANAMFMQQYNIPELVKRLLANQTDANNTDKGLVGDFYTPYSDYYNNTPNDSFYTRMA